MSSPASSEPHFRRGLSPELGDPSMSSHPAASKVVDRSDVDSSSEVSENISELKRHSPSPSSNPKLRSASVAKHDPPDADSSSDSDSVRSATRDENKISLQVGERRFTITCDTLTHSSGYFASLFSSPRAGSSKKTDHPYFIDADPELFSHILRYLRRKVLPVFWDKQKGHNHALYLQLLEEARFFQIARLEQWLAQKQYLAVVQVHSTPTLCQGLDLLNGAENAEVTKEYHPSHRVIKHYMCPRGLAVHKSLWDCGKACEKSRGNADPQYEESTVLETLVITKVTNFDHTLCLQ